jgi:hypothetical protein
MPKASDIYRSQLKWVSSIGLSCHQWPVFAFIIAENGSLPVYWRNSSGIIEERIFQSWVTLNPQDIVKHVTWNEVMAYCKWSKQRSRQRKNVLFTGRRPGIFPIKQDVWLLRHVNLSLPDLGMDIEYSWSIRRLRTWPLRGLFKTIFWNYHDCAWC